MVKIARKQLVIIGGIAFLVILILAGILGGWYLWRQRDITSQPSEAGWECPGCKEIFDNGAGACQKTTFQGMTCKCEEGKSDCGVPDTQLYCKSGWHWADDYSHCEKNPEEPTDVVTDCTISSDGSSVTFTGSGSAKIEACQNSTRSEGKEFCQKESNQWCGNVWSKNVSFTHGQTIGTGVQMPCGVWQVDVTGDAECADKGCNWNDAVCEPTPTTTPTVTTTTTPTTTPVPGDIAVSGRTYCVVKDTGEQLNIGSIPIQLISGTTPTVIATSAAGTGAWSASINETEWLGKSIRPNGGTEFPDASATDAYTGRYNGIVCQDSNVEGVGFNAAKTAIVEQVGCQRSSIALNSVNFNLGFCEEEVEPGEPAIKKSATTSCVVGEGQSSYAIVKYRVTISNPADNGQAVTYTHVKDYLDARIQASWVSNISDGGTLSGGVITWAGGTLADGASKTFKYRVTIPYAYFGTYQNVAIITYPEGQKQAEYSVVVGCAPGTGIFDDARFLILLAVLIFGVGLGEYYFGFLSNIFFKVSEKGGQLTYQSFRAPRIKKSVEKGKTKFELQIRRKLKEDEE